MEQIKNLIKKFCTKEVIFYGIFGVLTTVINIVSFYIMTNFLNLEENLSKTEYKLNDEELYLYKQLLTEISRVLPKNYYYITYRGFNNWFVITDLSNDEELCRANLNAISVFEYNKYKNDADIYICVKHKPDNSLSGRDEWRSKCGMD